jgi:phosphohistidine phosphatase
MKRLLLLRHGNASPGTEGGTDHDRPLDNIGNMQIRNIADKLLDQGCCPNLIITSSAVRANSSAEIIKDTYLTSNKAINKLIKTEKLYSASLIEYIDILSSQNNSFESILLVAHNPTISGFISRLTGKHTGMGTGNLCILDLDVNKWSDMNLNSTVISSTLVKP